MSQVGLDETGDIDGGHQISAKVTDDYHIRRASSIYADVIGGQQQIQPSQVE